jgi:aminoglycoside 3-N-acetyltransferase
MGERELIEATVRPSTAASLCADLRHLGVPVSQVIIVHTSMSALGWVIGGAQAVVEALLAAVGPEGTVVVPTQTGHLSDPARWSNPPVLPEWFDVIRAEMPAFDPALTPTRGMGEVVECLRQHPGAVRSSHPTVSFAAVGPRAESIVGSHPLSPGLGATSPLQRLVDVDASVLLLGVDHGNDTLLHLAEHRAVWPGKQTYVEGAPVLVDGVRKWVTWTDLDLDDGDFAALGDAFASTGRERTGSVGAGRGRLCRAREVVEFATDWITQHRT